ncbi:MAG: class I SAM-dependent methyltransferase [Chitinophagia bacterium]|jgi:cephalosporin hydroxylase|nr:class I SAM-dependent methyltransferase [Chitinophagia bacterium]
MQLRVVRGLEQDSLDYHVLSNSVNSIKNVPGIVCEIGTRRGGSLKVIVDALISSENLGRNVVCIDPYGNIDYPPGELEGNRPLKLDYTNDMRNETLPALYEYLQGKPVNVVFHCLEDTEFFDRFSDGVPFYNQYKIIENTYALVFFDGPHTLEALKKEVDFFDPRSVAGSMWIFDDVELYPHDQLEQILFENNWELIEKTQRKASYMKK